MIHLFALIVLLTLQGILLRSFPEAFSHTEVQLTLNFGFLLLAAYLFGEWAHRIRLPKLTGYLFAGILLGPDLMGYFTRNSVSSLRFIDDLALTFIALSAGLELRMQDLRKQWRILSGLITGIPLFVFVFIFLFVFFAASGLGLLPQLPTGHKILMACLLGTLAIARSPSSTVAVIKECKAQGPFSETVLCVTVAMDILVIVLFSLIISLSGLLLPNSATSALSHWFTIPLEILLSFLGGFALAWVMVLYARRIQEHRIFFMLCIAFLVTRLSHAFSDHMESAVGIALHLEPLLICMSAGFFIRNVFDMGDSYEESIDQSFLPIFVIFFALAGTALDLQSLASMWPFALLYAGIRILGVFFASHCVMRVLRQPVAKGNLYGLSFITQAGVSIGLASLIPKRFPDEGDVLFSLLLAVIVINQVLGPIAFKYALEKSGEAKNARQKGIASNPPGP